jgi:hypothetical protein
LFPDTNNRPSWFSDYTGTGIVPGKQHTWMNSNAVGTGPYLVTKNDPGAGQEYAVTLITGKLKLV